MKVYDIILAFIRALVVLDLIRELSNFVFIGVRLSAVLDVTRSQPYRVAETINLVSPVIGMITSLIIFAASRPIAEFDSKLATAEERNRV